MFNGPNVSREPTKLIFVMLDDIHIFIVIKY